MNSIDRVNKLSKSGFISIFGNVFEKTEWIAQKSYDSKPYKNIEELFSKMMEILKNFLFKMVLWNTLMMT